MFIWGLVLFTLGILAVLDSQLNYGYVFRSANSIVFLLVSLGVLIRTRILQKLGYKENLRIRNMELSAKVKDLERSQQRAERTPAEQEVTA